MAAAKRKQSSRRSSSSPRLTIRESSVDLWWKWTVRGCAALIPIFGGLWWLFAYYNGVEVVKVKVGELSHKVEAMWTGQTEILTQLKKIEKSAGKQPSQP